MRKIPINLKPSYDILIGNGILRTATLSEYCKQLKKKIIIITDSNVIDLIGTELQSNLQEQQVAANLICFPAGEVHKTREIKQTIEDELLKKHYGRDTCLIALGGGVVTDLVGFVAATYCRGVPVIYIPTTLLGMVDASIGGKTGVNTPHGKNLIGCFYQPKLVMIDPLTLNTLPELEWQNGIAEMIKHSITFDAEIFQKLKNNVDKIKKRDADFLNEMIYASILIKKNIVEQDEKETGIRQLLNFGHTIGHALETVENYQISHGKAVAIGMVVESYLSNLLGFLPEQSLASISDILHAYNLLSPTKGFQNKQSLQNILQMDKKAIGNVTRFVLLDDIGKPHIQNNEYTSAVDSNILNQALDWGANFFANENLKC